LKSSASKPSFAVVLAQSYTRGRKSEHASVVLATAKPTEPTIGLISMAQRFCLLVVALLLAQSGVLAQTSIQQPEKLAQSVTIHRDTFGVPHIFGKTDAAVIFGLAYVQCEDNFWQLETDYINALGRAAELEGEKALARDLTFRLFEIEKLSRSEYERLPAKLRALCDAFAAGVNYYITRNPQSIPRLLTRLEGWHVVAFARSGRVGSVNRLGLSQSEIQLGRLETNDKAAQSGWIRAVVCRYERRTERGLEYVGHLAEKKHHWQRDAADQSARGLFRRRPTLRSAFEE
jgi:hypothetical protein